MVDELQEGPPLDELPPDDKPSNRLTNEERAQRGMKPVGRPKGSGVGAAPKSKGRKRSLEGEIQVTLTLLNYAFAFAPPEFRGDMLDEVEIVALSRSINEAAMMNSRMYQVLDSALRGGGTGMIGIIVTVGAIAGRRLARHGLVPAEADENLGMILQMQVNPQAAIAMMQQEQTEDA